MQSAPRKLVLRAPPQRVVRAPAQQPFGARLDLDPQLQLLSVEYLAALDNSNLPGLVDLARLFPSTRSLDTSLESTRPARGQPLVVIDWPTLKYVRGSAGSFANWRNVMSTHLLELVDQLHLQGPRKARTVVDPKARVFLAAVDNVQPVALIARLDSKLPAPFWMELIRRWNRGSARLRYFAVELFDINSDRTCEVQLARWWANVSAAVKSSGTICLEVRCPLRRDMQRGGGGQAA
ncbi:hypothetical protein DAEQUDRAFT_469150 [Daedalea quercina L-15889]|uniref:F-box domain-containing protein n=1 Tax=Daedalea quercina L-15889 TaxID=1314783 RepID=A0A165TGN3_9APHY|nr:hypothetical protein DAEQUDRAFT_469150 [Daedalea quercina L-15889]